MKNSDTSTVQLDTLDRRIVAVLQIEPRASWGRVAQVLGETERTVARRAHRLFNMSVLRVQGLVQTHVCGLGDPFLMTFMCRASMVGHVAEELAAIPNTRSVELITGSNDLMVEAVWREDDLPRFLLDQLPNIAGVEGYRTHSILRYFRTPDEWRHDSLTAAERSVLDSGSASHVERNEEFTVLSEDDRGILDLLRRDCRMSYVAISQQLDISVSTARRKVESLLTRGLLMPRTEIEPSLLAPTLEAIVWVKCDPSKIESAGRSLSQSASAMYVTAITGEFQLMFIAAVANKAALYTLLNSHVGATDGIRAVEVSLSLKVFKRGFVRRDGVLLSSYPPSIAELTGEKP